MYKTVTVLALSKGKDGYKNSSSPLQFCALIDYHFGCIPKAVAKKL
jgi:hypothetical protein